MRNFKIFLLLGIFACAAAFPLRRVTGDSQELLCKLHKELLKTDKVPIIYGYILDVLSYDEAQAELFPHSNTWFRGGCIYKPETEVEIHYCEKCREAEKKWCKENEGLCFSDEQSNNSFNRSTNSVAFIRETHPVIMARRALLIRALGARK